MSRDYLLVAVFGRLIVVASLVVTRALERMGSGAMVHTLVVSPHVGFILDQGLNQGPLHWQEDS